jgi:hypothetical protein
MVYITKQESLRGAIPIEFALGLDLSTSASAKGLQSIHLIRNGEIWMRVTKRDRANLRILR